MAVLVSIDIPGVSKDQFEEVGGKLLPQIKQQQGFIAHGGWVDGDGVHIREMWESEEDHQRWFRDVVAPTAGDRMPSARPPMPTVTKLDHVQTR